MSYGGCVQFFPRNLSCGNSGKIGFRKGMEDDLPNGFKTGYYGKILGKKQLFFGGICRSGRTRIAALLFPGKRRRRRMVFG